MGMARIVKKRFYVIVPAVAIVLIFANMMYGHMVFSTVHPQSIEKYSIYVHFVDGWNSYPGNILFDVTNVWNDPRHTEALYFEPLIGLESIPYNSNQLQHVGNRSFVALAHHYSDCQTNWQPILYRYGLDVLRNQFEILQGAVSEGHPYALMYPDVLYHADRLETGYLQFIPICTAQDTASYKYSIKSNDPGLGFDVFFVADMSEYEILLREPLLLETYNGRLCPSTGHVSISGTCHGLPSDAGLILWLPDSLNLALTKITVNLREL